MLNVKKCKDEFKNGSNPVIMPLCYAMLCWAGRCVNLLADAYFIYTSDVMSCSFAFNGNSAFCSYVFNTTAKALQPQLTRAERKKASTLF